MMEFIKKIVRFLSCVVRGVFFRISYRIGIRKKRKALNELESETKHLVFSVSELFMQQHKGNLFNRYDIIVRLLAIECEHGLNNYGWDLYRKMQVSRVGVKDIEERIKNFKALISSYDNNGYNEKSEIELDCNLHLIDGSHRMAMALYHGLTKISAKVRPFSDNVFYGVEFFLINGFTEKEITAITNRYDELLTEGVNSPFICTLWHPARDFFDEITSHLSLFGKVVEVKDFALSEWDYRFYTKGICHVDDIEDWKVEKKLEYMLSERSDVYHLRMVALELTNPDFRLKDSTNGTLSRKCEFIKKLIRDSYKKQVNNYFHDIILHIGDNFYQNKYIYRLLMMPPIDVKSILNHLSPYQYVITKVDTPYMPKDFPLHYPLGKDIDIICADKEEYEKVFESIKRDVEPYKDAYDIQYVEKRDDDGNVYRTLVRLEQDGYLAFQFDIGCRTGNLSYNFSRELCNNRLKKDGYFVPNESTELVVRIDEIENYPKKLHHIQFVREHISELDNKVCEEFLSDSGKRILNKINQDIAECASIETGEIFV